jgi:hypothetical protein
LRGLGVSPGLARLTAELRSARVGRVDGHRGRMRQRVERGHLQVRIEESAEADRQLGFESAYPLLDRDLLELVVSLPADQLLHGGHNRSLMRDVLDGRMSDLVRARRDKTGAVSDHADRWIRWVDIYEDRTRHWSASPLVRHHVDPDVLLTSIRQRVAVDGNGTDPAVDPMQQLARPVVARLMSLAAFLASVDEAPTPAPFDPGTPTSCASGHV